MTKLQDTLINKLQNCEELKDCEIDSVQYKGENETGHPSFIVRLNGMLYGPTISRLEFMGFYIRWISGTTTVSEGLGLSMRLEYLGHQLK
jgi:hypothetical protein